SKYRPSSEQHNDNFSLSTIAEGSHPNVRKLSGGLPGVWPVVGGARGEEEGEEGGGGGMVAWFSMVGAPSQARR
ncbi:hypothetical protein CRUP_006162, partial [Coryphaenoides rupestris]